MRKIPVRLVAVCAVAIVIVAIVAHIVLNNPARLAQQAVEAHLAGFVVPDPKKDENAYKAWPEVDLGDGATADRLRLWGVDVERWHRALLGHMSYEIIETTASDDAHAQVTVAFTNVQVPAILDAAASDTQTLLQSSEAQNIWQQGGRGEFFKRMMDSVFARLEAADAPTTTTTVQVPVVKDDKGTWQVQMTPEVWSALYGGLDITAVTQ